jgi:sugar (pentulose or hexulose) kinase
MSTKYILGIDGGSQSSKVVIFDTEGRAICEATEELVPLHTPRPGVAEHPDDDLYDSIVKAARRAVESLPGKAADIIGVGLCTIRCCRALVKKDGTLAAPVQSWMDLRLSRPYEHTDDEVAFVTTSSGYLMGRLTGSFTDTAANYIGPWPMDVGTWDWFTDKETFDSFNIPKEMLFKLQMPGEIGGFVNEEFAKATGLPLGLPVIHTANDKATEALGAGLRDERQGLVSLGTYIAAMVVGGDFVKDAQSYFTNFACEPNRYVYESAGIRRGMWTVSWLKNLVGFEIGVAAASQGLSKEEHLNQVASLVPAGCEGLMCVLDWLASPTQPHKKGMFIGFDERHGYAHMYRSILEGIAFRMKQNVAAMESDLEIELEKLVLSGGGSNSDLMAQIFADVFNIPVLRNQVRNAAGLGAAICVAVACGVYPSFDSATDGMVQVADETQPNPDLTDLYGQLGEVYTDISAQTDVILERTFSILTRSTKEPTNQPIN